MRNVFKFVLLYYFMVKEAYKVMEEVLGKGPDEEHKLTYDSPTETLEPIYFFILDLMSDFGFKVEKLVDNFVSSPGSGHFGEMGQRSSVMQQQGSKLMADINTVLRSIINLIYDLRNFEIRLGHYDALDDSDAQKIKAARLALKQMWMDKVDIQKGNSSIKAMAMGQAGFSTLIDAFLVCDNEKDVDEIDLNQIIKRILKPRVFEFNMWIKESQSELQKRYDIERSYLKSQVASLKMYTNWARPYLKAAEDLQMSQRDRHPALVKMFNTILMELTLVGQRGFEIKDEDGRHVEWDDHELGAPNLPKAAKFSSDKKYYEIMLVDFNFRGIPQRTQQGYSAGGKTHITFKGYSLDENQLRKFYEEFDKSDLYAGLELLEGLETGSLTAISEDIEKYMAEEKEAGDSRKKKDKEKPKDMSNPFLALFGIYNKKDEKKKSDDKKDEDIKLNYKDARLEREYILNALASATAISTYTFFDIYKKAHGMVTFPT